MDLIEHFRLDAQIYDDHTLHTSYVSDHTQGMRKVKIEKIWYKDRRLGQGGFGDVWLEVQKEHDRVIASRAVKAIRKHRMKGLDIDYRRELLALAKLSRYAELFVTLFGWYENNDDVFLAMEFFQCGDLQRYIESGINEDGAKIICSQLLDGISLLHSLGFTHLDLKPQNIFVASGDPKWWVKIGDFGISKRISTEQTALRTQIGTQLFQAPEMLGYVDDDDGISEYTNAVDIWALGCVMYLIMARTMPFPKPRAMATYCSGRSQFPSGPLTAKGISKEGVGCVEDLLNPQPFKRPSASSASQHEWFLLSHPIQTNSGALADPEIKVHHSPPFRPTSPILLPAEEASTETPANTQDGSPIEHPRTPNISVDGRLNNEARHKSRRTEKSPIAMFSRGYTDSVARSSSDGTPTMPSPVHTEYGKFFVPKELQEHLKEHNDRAEYRHSTGAMVEVVPGAGKSKPMHPFEPFTYRPFGMEIEDDPTSFPWHIPELRLVEPTPPGSQAHSVRGDSSPMITPKEPEPPTDVGELLERKVTM